MATKTSNMNTSMEATDQSKTEAYWVVQEEETTGKDTDGNIKFIAQRSKSHQLRMQLPFLLSLIKVTPTNDITSKASSIPTASATIQTNETITIDTEQEERTATPVWDASVVLSRFLLGSSLFPELHTNKDNKFGQGWLSGKRILDLGSGCGFSSIALFPCYPKEIIATELGDVVPVLRRNILKNSVRFGQTEIIDDDQNSLNIILRKDEKATVVRVFELYWGEDAHLTSLFSRKRISTGKADPEEESIDVIIGTDIVYELQNFSALVYTLYKICAYKRTKYNKEVDVLLLCERRWKDVETWFLDDVGKYFNHSYVFSPLIPPTQYFLVHLLLKPDHLLPAVHFVNS